MRSSAVEYLRDLETLASRSRKEDFYLWPDTPSSSDLQEEIAERVGVSDRDVDSRRSRPALIARQLRSLMAHGLIGPDFSTCDIACGDGLVLWHIKKLFPQARCTGVDCRRGMLAPHDMVQRNGVELIGGYIQHLFARDPPVSFDVALMLNTYRDWESAVLRAHERDLPRLADAWFERNARYTVVTATNSQIRRLKKAGFGVARLGPGEDHSTLICFSRLPLPQSLEQRLHAMGHRLLFGTRFAYLAKKAYRYGGLSGVLRAALGGLRRRLAARLTM